MLTRKRFFTVLQHSAAILSLLGVASCGGGPFKKKKQGDKAARSESVAQQKLATDLNGFWLLEQGVTPKKITADNPAKPKSLNFCVVNFVGATVKDKNYIHGQFNIRRMNEKNTQDNQGFRDFRLGKDGQFVTKAVGKDEPYKAARSCHGREIAKLVGISDTPNKTKALTFSTLDYATSLVDVDDAVTLAKKKKRPTVTETLKTVSREEATLWLAQVPSLPERFNLTSPPAAKDDPKAAPPPAAPEKKVEQKTPPAKPLPPINKEPPKRTPPKEDKKTTSISDGKTMAQRQLAADLNGFWVLQLDEKTAAKGTFCVLHFAEVEVKTKSTMGRFNIHRLSEKGADDNQGFRTFRITEEGKFASRAPTSTNYSSVRSCSGKDIIKIVGVLNKDGRKVLTIETTGDNSSRLEVFRSATREDATKLMATVPGLAQKFNIASAPKDTPPKDTGTKKDKKTKPKKLVMDTDFEV